METKTLDDLENRLVASPASSNKSSMRARNTLNTARRWFFFRAMLIAFAPVALLTSPACLIDDQVDAWTAYKRVYAVHRARLQHCETPERFIYLIPVAVKEPDLQACEADMLAAPCAQDTPILSCSLLMIRGAD